MEMILIMITLAAVVAAIRERLQSQRLLRQLDNMLEKAVEGSFHEEVFDESRLSALESRMAHWLSAASLMRETLETEKERIQVLISDISHQLKTPAANVLLYAQLLSEQVLPPNVRAYATALEGQSKKLCALTETLLRLSRLETGILTLHPTSGDLAPMLEDTMAQFAPHAAEKGITLTLVPSVGIASAIFDPKWTAEAICNLLDNAIKYTPSEGKVAVQVIAYEYFCRINVSDTGPGIPEEEQAKIFQRFYRSATAHEMEGLGIGLYLAREIAEGQGGYLKVYSPKRGGAVFSLFLPRN